MTGRSRRRLVAVDGAPADGRASPPVASQMTNLPVRRSRMIGRQRELAEIQALLLRDDVGLVTLTGPGGSGKTRLAIAVATAVVDQFADGACFVPLGPISDPELVTHAICEALGVREAGGRPLTDRLEEHLRAAQLLLVLDNFEQVLVAAPHIVELMERSPHLKVLVTSRAVLRVSGEYTVPVSPLSVPPRADRPQLENVAQYDAVQLFVARARAARPDFALTPESTPAVAEICRRLDGLPLAIELAASRVRVLSPQAMLDRLDTRLALLTGGPMDRPSHQQTLRGTIAWSYDLLDEPGQALFRRLAVFVGGFDLDAVNALASYEPCVASDEPDNPQLATRYSQLDGVQSLVDQSLLQRADVAGEPRLTMLETVREYALEQLAASGEAAAVRRRHAEYVLALAETAEPRLLGPEQRIWLDRLEREHDNIRAALAWSRASDRSNGSADRPGRPPAELGLRLAGALAWFWYIRCHLIEGRRWLEPMVTGHEEMPADVRARGLVTLGRLMQAQSDLARSSTLFDEAIDRYRQVGDRWWTAFSIGARGQNAMIEAAYQQAETLFEESLALFTVQGDRWGVGWSLGNLGRAAHARGRHARALDLLTQSLAIKREVGDPFALALALTWEGRATYDRGDHQRATALLEESLGLFHEVGYPRGVGGATCYLAAVANAQGDHDRAVSLYATSLEVQRGEGFKSGIAQCLEGLAGASLQRAMTVATAGPGRRQRLQFAARTLGTAEALREAIGVPLPPVDRGAYQATLAVLRAELGSELAPVWDTGRAAPLEEAVEEALTSAKPLAAPLDASPAEASRSTLDPAAGLSRRERDVVARIAQGHSNPQIGRELGLSRRTVETHMTSVFNKLGLSSRAQVAVWAVQHGLVQPDPA
jgi:predicted ATPase/DNA-binding CsgD family transcriptional regulator